MRLRTVVGCWQGHPLCDAVLLQQILFLVSVEFRFRSLESYKVVDVNKFKLCALRRHDRY